MARPLDGVTGPRSLLSQLLARARILVWATDGDLSFTATEGEGLELLGRHGDDMVGLNALEVFKEKPAIVAALISALEGHESRTTTPLSHGRKLENWYIPLRSADGRVRGVMGLSIGAPARAANDHVDSEQLAHLALESALRGATITWRTPVVASP